MIAFVAVRHSSIREVTSGQVRPRTATNDRERGQLQPELQPPKWTAPVLHTALTVLPGPPASDVRGRHRSPGALQSDGGLSSPRRVTARDTPSGGLPPPWLGHHRAPV